MRLADDRLVQLLAYSLAGQNISGADAALMAQEILEARAEAWRTPEMAELKAKNAYLEGARDTLQSMLNKERTKT